MNKLELKHIAPYLPYGLKVTFEGEEDLHHELVGLDITNDGAKLLSPYNDFGSCPLDNCKPILQPLSALTIEEFGEIIKDAYGLKDVVTFHCAGGTMWVTNKEADYETWEDGDAEYMRHKEEDDSEAVVSMNLYQNGTPRMDLAYGMDDEFRYFIGYQEYDNIRQEFLKRHFDLYALIKAGLAVDATKTEGGVKC